ncbi:DEAD/DEAH box helicase [Kutzneria kofuensis]|uniref:Superfamily II DNA or RNA helicase n=2 Tax=Kutzneria kofuensis TaxID=103725 RepID=A0A7W9KHC5_9PSEU|nr:DEAD/DEAH box helicase [Kutzneria kofuensis]MBB5891829.1 superfamily II DNA or RNA helicase [Kutzneria kofuensis]
MAFWGAELPTGMGELGALDIVEAQDQEVRVRTVPALRLPVADAVPLLSRARRDRRAHPATAFWGAATVVALQLVARGRLKPTVSPGDYDAWRVGPLDPADQDRIAELVAAMPAEARAVPVPDRLPLELPDAHQLVEGFLDAVADGMPRGGSEAAFLAAAPQRVPQLRAWADGVSVSLRIEFDGRFRAIVQLHSVSDPGVVSDAAEVWAGAGRARAQSQALVALRRAARVWPALNSLLHKEIPDEIILLDDEVRQLLAGAADRLAAKGVPVHWPKELARQLVARVAIGGGSAPRDMPGFLGGNEALRFDWQVALGDDPLTKDELEQLAQAHRPIVRLREQWQLVDADLARRVQQRELTPLNPLAALGLALTGTAEIDGEQIEVVADGWLAALRDRIADAEGGAELLAQPPALAGLLRDYQLRGLRWLARMTSLGLGCCLADDMGLGKTITVIALHLHRAAGPTLVVCPASLLGNWEREIRRFAPGVPVRRFHGSARDLADVDGFVLTTYGTMRLDAEELGAVPWDLVVADEAQHVKNARSATAKALRTIKSGVRVALTGTPVENTLFELWAILDWATPGLLGSQAAFRRRWAKPIEADKDEETARRLARLLRPFLLRRGKSDPGIAPELPAKTETDQLVPLTREQAGLYEAVVRETLTEIAETDGMARRGLIIKLLTSLKQICNHPAQYLKQTDARLTGRSGKLALFDELVGTIVAEDHAVLVFTQYVAMAELLSRHLAERGLPSQFLHGGTPVARREAMVARFQDGEVPIFLISLKAGGTGLNLTRADHVVHYDRWWNPAVEDQATDRAYRIGQTRPVQVHRLMTEGTIEDRIAAMLAGKRALADAVLTGGEAALTELTDAELADLVELR